MMKDPGWIQVILGFFNFLACYATASIEEGEMLAKFGADYTVYRKETKMFIPFIM
jgi:protein-S-isoprenylcysteine O-methyltransferase Ste14